LESRMLFRRLSEKLLCMVKGQWKHVRKRSLPTKRLPAWN